MTQEQPSKASVKKSEQPTLCQEKWKKDTDLDINESFNWKTAYQISFTCTKSSKLIYLNFTFLHRLLRTNSF